MRKIATIIGQLLLIFAFVAILFSCKKKPDSVQDKYKYSKIFSLQRMHKQNEK